LSPKHLWHVLGIKQHSDHLLQVHCLCLQPSVLLHLEASAPPFVIYFYESPSNLFLIIRAGFPPTILKSETSLVTIEPAAIITPFPMFTPGRIITRVPIHTSFPIDTGSISELCFHIGTSLF